MIILKHEINTLTRLNRNQARTIESRGSELSALRRKSDRQAEYIRELINKADLVRRQRPRNASRVKRLVKRISELLRERRELVILGAAGAKERDKLKSVVADQVERLKIRSEAIQEWKAKYFTARRDASEFNRIRCDLMKERAELNNIIEVQGRELKMFKGRDARQVDLLKSRSERIEKLTVDRNLLSADLAAIQGIIENPMCITGP